MKELIEPSDWEQGNWPDATCYYVRGLEDNLKTLTALLAECEATCEAFANNHANGVIAWSDRALEAERQLAAQRAEIARAWEAHGMAFGRAMENGEEAANAQAEIARLREKLRDMAAVVAVYCQ